jgi:hypothetical protein
MELYPSKAQETIESRFLKQFTRLQEGIRLSKYVEWNDDEHCFDINGHLVQWDSHKGWMCDCEDRIFTKGVWWCKHMLALIFYMGGLPQAQEMVKRL